MRQTVTLNDFHALGGPPGKCCEACGQSIRSGLSKGPLEVRDSPEQAFWRGRLIEDIAPTKVRLLGLLIRFGRCDYTSLSMMLSEKADVCTVKVHIWHMRPILTAVSSGQVVIKNIWGWGYELVVRDFE